MARFFGMEIKHTSHGHAEYEEIWIMSRQIRVGLGTIFGILWNEGPVPVLYCFMFYVLTVSLRGTRVNHQDQKTSNGHGLVLRNNWATACTQNLLDAVISHPRHRKDHPNMLSPSTGKNRQLHHDHTASQHIQINCHPKLDISLIYHHLIKVLEFLTKHQCGRNITTWATVFQDNRP